MVSAVRHRTWQSGAIASARLQFQQLWQVRVGRIRSSGRDAGIIPKQRKSNFHGIASTALVLASGLLLSACNNTNGATPGVPAGGTLDSASPPPIGWDTSPNAVIFRLDRTLNGEPVVNAHNRLPLCTLFGNGHLVWVNPTPPNGEQILEAQLDTPTIQSFADFAIRQQHFYSIPDYAANELPPSGQYTTESISLNLNNTAHTIRNYSHWPGNEFQNMLDKCGHLTQQPVLYVPTGAWLEVYPVSGPDPDPPILWTSAVPFRLADVASSGKPLWLSGDLLGTLWRQIHRSLGAVQWIENNKAYQIALEVPNISRDAPLAPQVTPTLWPTLSPSPVLTKPPTSTRIPTRTPTSIHPTPPTPFPLTTDEASS
ncbi:MAG: hypothetical protein ACYDBJ_18795 [Aggregatilineales bacterium]